MLADRSSEASNEVGWPQSGGQRHREEEAAPELLAIDRNKVDLMLGITLADVAVPRPPIAHETDDHDRTVTPETSRFVLDLPEASGHLKDQVDATMLLSGATPGHPTGWPRG
jgi:hypothetical protein